MSTRAIGAGLTTEERALAVEHHDDPYAVSFDAAVEMLPEGDDIHTFRQGGMMLLGADWDRVSLLAAMKAAPAIRKSGDIAQSMDHGLAIHDGHGWLFIRTKREGAAS